MWWKVADALRASNGDTTAAFAAALADVDDALAALRLATDRTPAATSPGPSPLPRYADDEHALRRARVLVARLLFSAGATSPTLLQVRLERLRRALDA